MSRRSRRSAGGQCSLPGREAHGKDASSSLRIAHDLFQTSSGNPRDRRKKRPLILMRNAVVIHEDTVAVATSVLLQRQRDQIAKSAVPLFLPSIAMRVKLRLTLTLGVFCTCENTRLLFRRMAVVVLVAECACICFVIKIQVGRFCLRTFATAVAPIVRRIRDTPLSSTLKLVTEFVHLNLRYALTNVQLQRQWRTIAPAEFKEHPHWCSSAAAAALRVRTSSRARVCTVWFSRSTSEQIGSLPSRGECSTRFCATIRAC